MQNKIHSIKYNYIMNFILSVSKILFPLITFPYVAKALLPVGSGRVAFAASTANYFLLIASLGIPAYGIRACAVVREDKDKLSKTVQEVFFIHIASTFLVIIIYIICIFSIRKFYEDRILFLIYGIGIVLNMFGMNWVFQALELYDYITIRALIFKIISVIFIFIAVKQPKDYVVYGTITVFADAGPNLINYIRIKKIIHFKKYEEYQIRKHLKPIMILFSQVLATSIYTNLDTIMLGFLKTDMDVGYYHIAVKAKEVLVSLIASMGAVLLPRMSYYYKHDLMDSFKQIMVKALNFTIMTALPLAVFFIIFAKDTVLFISTRDYLAAIPAMQIILVSTIPIAITGIIGMQVLMPMEKEKYVLYSFIVGAVMDFFLNLLLIPRFGATGASISTVIAEVFVLLIQMWFVKEFIIELIREIKFPLYFLTTIACIVPVLVFRSMIKMNNSFISLVFGSMLFLFMYGGMLLLKQEPLLKEFVKELEIFFHNIMRKQ